MITSIELFFNELKRMQYFIGKDKLKAYKQAKKTQKQEIINAHIFAELQMELYFNICMKDFEESSEDYYNKTYKK